MSRGLEDLGKKGVTTDTEELLYLKQDLNWVWVLKNGVEERLSPAENRALDIEKQRNTGGAASMSLPSWARQGELGLKIGRGFGGMAPKAVLFMWENITNTLHRVLPGNKTAHLWCTFWV